MRVVTIENFGDSEKTGEGNIYNGDAWLLRFAIGSPDHFFQSELPNLINVLGIHPAEIYRLALYGHGSGLYDVRVHISFE